MFNPEIADAFVRAGQGQIGSRFRMSEVRRIEIQTGFLFLRPVNPALEMFRFDSVAFDSASGIQINGMEIQTFCAGDQTESEIQVGAEFFHIAGASGIISSGKNPAGSAAGILFKSVDVIPLPAMQGNRNLRQCGQCFIRIYAHFGITCLRRLIAFFDLFH